MKGTLNSEFEKKGKKYLRKLNPDRSYISTGGEKKNFMEKLIIDKKCGSSHDKSCNHIKGWFWHTEGLMDAFITTAAAIHDLQKNKFKNRINLHCKT